MVSVCGGVCGMYTMHSSFPRMYYCLTCSLLDLVTYSVYSSSCYSGQQVGGLLIGQSSFSIKCYRSKAINSFTCKNGSMS